MLLGELAAIVLVAQPLGWLIGYGFASPWSEASAPSFTACRWSSTARSMPWASVVVLAAAAIVGLVVRRRIDRLDMIEVLKTRE